MELTAIGRAALAGREGNELEAYRDSVGVLTIASGVTTASGLITVTPGLVITAAQADALNAKAFAKYAGYVSAAVKVPLAEHQADALISLCFNIGPAAFARSTVLKRLNAGNIAGAAEAILMWNRPAEIIPRRQGEYDQFRTPYATAMPRARRGDKAAVKAPAGVSPIPTVVAPKPAVAAPRPHAVAPSIAPAPAPAAATGVLAGILARLRAGFPVKG